MTALLYFLVAVLAAGLSTRAWLANRSEPARVAFLGLGWSVAISYVSFSLSLLPGLDSLRLVYMFAGSFVPGFALWCIDRLFSEDESPPSPHVARLFLATAVAAPLLTGLHSTFYSDALRASPIEMLAGLFAFGAFSLGLYRMYQAHQAADLRVDRARLEYLLAVFLGAVLFTLIEQLARNAGPPVDIAALSISSRGVVLQGAIPPFSTLFTGLGLYFFYQNLVMYRLLDLKELFSRIATLVVPALLLVLIDGITVSWVGTFTDYPIHTTFQVFLASVLFLAAYDPLRTHVDYWANRVLNRRGQQLSHSLVSLRAEIPTVISTRGLTETLLSRLHASGRVPVCSIYLWDRGLDAFACGGTRGSGGQRPLAAVAFHPFADVLADGEPWFLRDNVVRYARHDEAWVEILALMDAMNADLTVPFISKKVVMGWINLRDEEWSDGYSADEMQRLRELAQLASVALSNIREFQALEEEHRLAALGAMAAGLAHEIRNPLAGIKGAAQYLQHEGLPGDAQEMLSVVVDEANRLNVVVTQFLDYARPFELHLAPDHVNAIVGHVVSLVRAQGLPEGVTIHDALSADLPSLRIDGARLAQVVLNLAQNGAQAMKSGGTLTVATRRRRNRVGAPVVEISVSDTGVGIAADIRERLFVPFFTTKDDGTGLGLAISQRIVQAHGGEIDVHSVPGEGATFVVRLPCPDELTEEVEKQASGYRLQATGSEPGSD